MVVPEIGDPPPTARHVVGFLVFSHGWTWGFWPLAASLAPTTQPLELAGLPHEPPTP